MNRRTYILALAVTASGDDTPLPTYDADDVIDLLAQTAENITVVAVLDRDKPENNHEPQVFADYTAAPPVEFTEGMNEVVPSYVSMEQRPPNCCDPGFSTIEYPDINLDGYDDNDKTSQGYW